MNMHVVPDPEYQGEAGINAIRSLQQELMNAWHQEEWDKVRHLDRICALLVERVIDANRTDKSILVRALAELKGVYGGLIAQCQSEVTLVHAT